MEIDCPPTRKVALPRAGLEELGSRRICWSDLDGNGHLYSGNSRRHRSGTSCRRICGSGPPAAFYINYSREATLDQELRLLGIRDGVDAYLMEGVGPSGTCFTCRCEF